MWGLGVCVSAAPFLAVMNTSDQAPPKSHLSSCLIFQTKCKSILLKNILLLVSMAPSSFILKGKHYFLILIENLIILERYRFVCPWTLWYSAQGNTDHIKFFCPVNERDIFFFQVPHCLKNTLQKFSLLALIGQTFQIYQLKGRLQSFISCWRMHHTIQLQTFCPKYN